MPSQLHSVKVNVDESDMMHVQMTTAWRRNGICWNCSLELRSALVFATCKPVTSEEPSLCCCIVSSSVKLSDCAKGSI